MYSLNKKTKLKISIAILLLVSSILAYRYFYRANPDVLSEKKLALEAGKDFQKISDQEISNISDSEPLETFSDLRQGFSDIKLSVQGDKPLVKDKINKETKTEKKKVTSQYNLDGIAIITDYQDKDNGGNNVGVEGSGQRIKQTVTVKNQNKEDRTITFSTKSEISADKVSWEGNEYPLSREPQIFKAQKKTASIPEFAKDSGQTDLKGVEQFQNYTHTYTIGSFLTFKTEGDKTATYDWTLATQYDPEVKAYKGKDGKYYIETVFTNFKIPASEEKVIDPDYVLSNRSNYGSRLDGESHGDNFTDRLTYQNTLAMGDVNGDTIPDLVVGSYTADNNGESSGSAYVIFGQASPSEGNKPLDTDTNYNIRYDGGTTYDYLTYEGALAIGDVNGDGKGDLVLGAYNASYNDSSSGSAWVMFSTLIDDVGSTTGNNKPLSTAGNYNIRYDGGAAWDYLTDNGAIAIGDVNGDGLGDLVLATADASNNDSSSGSAWVMFSTLIDDVGSTTGNNKPLSTGTNYNIRYDGGAVEDYLTEYGALDIGDVNGDGKGDLVLGSFNASYNDSSSGSAWVIFSTLIDDVGSTTGNNKPLSTSTNYNIRYDGGAADDYLTDHAALTIGDVNGDGLGDLVLGTYDASYNGASSGSVWVMFSTLIDDVGSTTGNNKPLSTSTNYNIRYDGGAADDRLTYEGSLAIGDVNGDGKGDLVLGATHASNNGFYSGSAWVIFSTLIDDVGSTTGNNKPLSTGTNYNIRYDGGAADDQLTFGGALAIGDVNGDGLGDLVFGSANASNNGSSSGSAWVMFSTLIDDVTEGTTGQNKPLSTGASYNTRYDGGAADDYLTDNAALAIGDVNGDGLGDLVLGTYDASYNGSSSGSAWVMFSTLIDDVTTTGNNKSLNTTTNYNIRYDGFTSFGANFGSNIAIGDVNGDSIDDLVVGEPYANNNGTQSGSAYVIFGGANFSSVNGNMDIATNYNIRYDGGTTYDILTYGGILAIGDVNGDGKGDLVLGAANAGNNGFSSGSAWVMFSTLIDDVGSTTGNNKPLSTAGNYNIRYDGGAAENLTRGGAIAIGDVNGDGLGDLVLGTARASYNGASSSGSAYVMFSTLIDDVTTTGNNKPLSTAGNYNIRYDGGAANNYLTEYGALAIGDVNGDGKGDLVLGAFNASNNGSSSGSAYVIFSTLIDDVGSTTGNNKPLSTAGNYNIRYDGGAASNNLTRDGALAIGDVNGDGKGDLVLGSLNASNNGASSGSAWVMFSTLIDDVTTTGNNKSLNTTTNYNIRYDGGAANDCLTVYGALTIGDVNGDGNGDLVLGAYRASNNGASSGSAWVMFSTLIDDVTTTGNNKPLSTAGNYNIRYDGGAAGDGLTYKDLAIGDVNGDGKGDLVLGAASASNNGYLSGSAYVMFSTLIDDVTTTGNNKPLGTSTNYNIRYDGGADNDELTYGALAIGDVNGGGKKDLVLGTYAADNNGTDSGSVYVFSGEPKNVYYSVGIGSTANLGVGGSVSITNGAAVFSAAQTGNIGVGDRVTYNTNQVAYIAAKTNADMKHWTLVTATGGTPADVSNATVNSITHEYTTLEAAVEGAKDSNHINNTDLTSANVILNIPCYTDGTADTTAVTVSGYTTSATNYIKIYTPSNTTTESNLSQRASGKWDDTKYSLKPTSGRAVYVNGPIVKVEGIQVLVPNVDWAGGIESSNAGSTVSSCLVQGAANQWIEGIHIYGSAVAYNNTVWGFTLSAGFDGNNGIPILYNNTAYNNKYNFYQMDWAALKNNLAASPAAGGSDYTGAFGGTHSNNISSDATSPDASYRNQTVKFQDAANGDFHLNFLDTAALNAGANLSADANLPFNTDIDGQARNTLGAWDIGADEATTPIYRSVGVGATAALTTGTNNGLVISGSTANFAAPLPDNVGVGDALQYDSNQDGTVDAIAFISYRIDSTHFIVKKNDGSAPTAVSASKPDVSWGIYRAYTSLFNAEAGIENTGINSTYRNFDDWTAGGDATTDDVGKNLTTNNEQWNIALYANGTASDGAVTINGWTTAVQNYIRIFTPTQPNEVGISQRHSGQWDNTKYNINVDAPTSTTYLIYIVESFVRVDGLQLSIGSAGSNNYNAFNLYGLDPGDSDIRISNNIVKQGTITTGTSSGIYVSNANIVLKLWNNIFYNFNQGNPSAVTIAGLRKGYVYNNTFINNFGSLSTSLGSSGQNVSAKNNLIQLNSYNPYRDFEGTFSADSSNNVMADDSFSFATFGVQADSGVTTGTTASKLVDSTQNFLTTVKVGMIIKNTTDTTYAYVTAVDSDTQLSISSNIFASSENYIIYTNRVATASFINMSGYNFHLAGGDTAAKELGADLSSDSYLPITTDIDGQPRMSGTAFDIGADERLTNVYYSVGQKTTDLKNGTPTLTVDANSNADLAVAQTGNMGVGDYIEYGTAPYSRAYIAGKNGDGQHWKVVTALGDPIGVGTTMPINAIKHTFSTLNGALAGASGASYINNTNLQTAGVILNIPCYYDSAADTTTVSMPSYTTGMNNYIKIYTPFNTSTEANNSQRASGKWDSAKYNLTMTDNTAITINSHNVWIDGLQISISSAGSTLRSGIYGLYMTGIKASNNIIKGADTVGRKTGVAIYNSGNNVTTYIWNNIIYDMTDTNGNDDNGIRIYSGSVGYDVTAYVYNNTVSNCTTGIGILGNGSGTGTLFAKNNLTQGGTYGLYVDTRYTADASSANNVFSSTPYANAGAQINASGSFGATYFTGTTTSASAGHLMDSGKDFSNVPLGAMVHDSGWQFAYVTAVSAHDLTLSADIFSNSEAYSIYKNRYATAVLSDTANKDFHLVSTDTVAKDMGMDLSSDVNLPITTDIDGHSRNANLVTGNFDIGADEAATKIYRSIAPGATGNIGTTIQGGTFSVSGNVGTFTTAPGTHVGVGDVIQYDSDNNGTIDSIAFISGRTDATHYTLQNSIGGAPTATSAPDADWSLYRAYTVLNSAIGNGSAGTENTGINATYRNFDAFGTAGKNITAVNEQWNIAAYVNSTNTDTASVTIQSWTTSVPNYIKVYTPTAATEVGTSQRHQGVWTSNAYTLARSATQNIVISNDYIRVSGLQLDNTGSATYAIQVYGKYADLSNNLIRNAAIGIYFSGSMDYGKVYNNIIYGSTDKAISFTNTDYGYVYNNTLVNNAVGFYKLCSTPSVTNNIFSGNTSDYTSGGCGSDPAFTYNATNQASGIPAGTGNRYSQTFSFSDAANKDYHLASNDAAARNSGTDLSANTSFAFNTDIDGHTRNAAVNAWDIGADEGATAIYYSVGQSTAADLKSGTPKITLSGYAATFDAAQTGNIGVGDLVTYTGGSCFISGKTSTTVWNCQNAIGGTSPQVSNVSVTSIKRAFDSLNAAVNASLATSAKDTNHLNTTDLNANNYQLNISCYYDTGADTTGAIIQSWTTSLPNYIKIYTPNNTTTEVNNSQRHQGKPGTSNFKVKIPANSASYSISAKANYTEIVGMEVDVNGSNFGIASNGANYSKFHDNLVYNINGNNMRGISLAATSSASIGGYVYNNIVYDQTGSNYDGAIYNYDGIGYYYNNTVNNARMGYRKDGGTMYVKNNIAQNCMDGYNGTFASGSDYNISNATSDAPSASYRSALATTVTFVDAANKDFHLGDTDTSAIGAGANLSTDANFAFTTDIDGQTRKAPWDIGADETFVPIPVYFSVGQTATDFKTGTPTLDIASGVGTFSEAQTGNIGVGDRVTYNTDKIAYIAAKNASDMTQWRLITATGDAPPDVSGATVNSITHEYTSLSAAIAGAKDSSHLNASDLTANGANVVLNFPCYMESGTADTTAVSVSGYTTGAKNYIKIYTPNNTTTESNLSQRHNGKWDDTKYNLQVTGSNNSSAIGNNLSYTVIDGIQVKITSTVNVAFGIFTSVTSTISNNIVKGYRNVDNASVRGFFMQCGQYGQTIKIYNSIYLESSPLVGTYYNVGFYLYHYYQPNIYCYNCTSYGNSSTSVGFSGDENAPVVKNCLAQGSQAGFSGTFGSSSTNNISHDATAPAYNTYYRNTTVKFQDAANGDFHLNFLDIAALNAGTNLSADAGLAFNTDIDGQTRNTLGAWDIGADEATTPIYRSVGVGATSPIITGTNNGLVITGSTANFQAPLPDNVGVGDALQYDSDQNGTVDKIAFIYYRIDSTHYIVKQKDGTAPTAVSANKPDTSWGIYRAYISLANWQAGTENSGIAAGVQNFDTYSNGARDLLANNEQWNIACYGTGTADSTKVNVQNWTTAPLNFIKVYTPTATTEAGISQRHSGKYDTAKYRLEVTDNGLKADAVSYMRIEGLQVQVSSASSSTGVTIGSYGQVSFNIIVGLLLSDKQFSNGVWTGTGSKIFNNIIYGFTGSAGSNKGISLGSAGSPIYIYNNTIHSCDFGIVGNAASLVMVVKNNLVQNTTSNNYAAYSGASFGAGSSNNISSDNTSPNSGATDCGGHSCRSQAVSFVDSTNKDFHLANADTSAKNSGADLSADPYIQVTTDIDGLPRISGSAMDIGADERLVNVYYSVSGGGDTSTDRKVASTISITNGILSSSAPQTGNIGVGDEVIYGAGSKAYISGKIDQSNWTVVTATGDKPADVAAGTTLTSIKRVWTSLSAAIAGAKGASYINNADLKAAGVILNIPCYYDTGSDTTRVTISGYTTGANNYIKVYTPSNTTYEANNSQRASGKWDGAKYNLVTTAAADYQDSIYILGVDYIKIDGLQIKMVASGYSVMGISMINLSSSNKIQISNNIITSDLTGIVHGVSPYASANSASAYIWNNIIYDISYDGIYVASGNYYIYNNTIYNAYYGIGDNGGKSLLKNNAVFNSRSGNDYANNFKAGSINNTSSDSSANTSNLTNGLINKVAANEFVDVANRDFHLLPTSSLKDAGADLSFDPNLPITTDIDGHTRNANVVTGAYDIGADEATTKIYRSVGVGATAPIATTSQGGTFSVSGNIGTFTTAPGTNIGVGDVIQYSSNNTSVNSIAFITGRTDSTHYTLENTIGGAPTATTVADTTWGIYRAYTSLDNATGNVNAGTENTGINSTYRNFDAWSGGKNILASNEQWNFAAYANGTAPDTTPVTISGWATSAPNYVKVYTPTSLSEVGASQRHSGKWDDAKYKMDYSSNTTNFTIISVNNPYTEINGLQIYGHGSVFTQHAIDLNSNYDKILNCVIKGDPAVASFGTYSASGDYPIVANNIIYNMNRSIYLTVYRPVVSNNTLYNCGYGCLYMTSSNSGIVRNNIVSPATGHIGFDLGNLNTTLSGHNASSDGTSTGGTGDITNATFSFVNTTPGSEDLHLTGTDTVCRNAGYTLTNDPYYAFNTDIDGDMRPMETGKWDIGADEVSSATTPGTPGAVNINRNVNFGRNVNIK